MVKNHAFLNGNKRIAFIATGLFLRPNGWRLKKQRLDEIQMMLKLAGGEISEEEFASWNPANRDKYLRDS